MVEDWIAKAEVLVEALPYIRRFSDKVVVIKYGGAAMVSEELRTSFAVDVVLLKYIGMRPVIVHGGGPQIGEALARLGKESQFIDGLRVTDDETMDVVEMVLGGKVNREIVERMHRAGGRAVGLNGTDGEMLRVKRKLHNGQDIGRVGEVVAIHPEPLEAIADNGFIPVVAPIGVDAEGTTYNVNADEAAGAVARALRAEKLVLLTDVAGVLDRDGERISQLSKSEVDKAIDEGTIQGGMIPKVQCCLDAIAGGARRAHIIDGRVPHALLLEIFTDGGVGTLLTD